MNSAAVLVLLSAVVPTLAQWGFPGFGFNNGWTNNNGWANNNVVNTGWGNTNINTNTGWNSNNNGWGNNNGWNQPAQPRNIVGARTGSTSEVPIPRAEAVPIIENINRTLNVMSLKDEKRLKREIKAAREEAVAERTLLEAHNHLTELAEQIIEAEHYLAFLDSQIRFKTHYLATTEEDDQDEDSENCGENDHDGECVENDEEEEDSEDEVVSDDDDNNDDDDEKEEVLLERFMAPVATFNRVSPYPGMFQ